MLYTANWDEIYHSFFEQLEGTECLMLRAKIGLDGQCDWTVIIIAINTMNHPKIQEQASLDSATTSAIAQGIINMKSKQYPTEVKKRAVELLIESQKDYPSLWAAIQAIAPKFCAACEHV